MIMARLTVHRGAMCFLFATRVPEMRMPMPKSIRLHHIQHMRFCELKGFVYRHVPGSDTWLNNF
jgi:hypothetical protein